MSDNFNRRFAAKLAAALRVRNLYSEADLAREAHVSVTRLRGILGGSRDATFEEALGIARALGVSLDELGEGLMDFEWEGE